MGQTEYEMCRAIPAEEIGMENPCHHMSYNEWREWLANEISQKDHVTYAMYLESYPIGYVIITVNEKADSGNISYGIRPVCRGKGLSVVMLNLAINEAKELGIRKLTGFANKFNSASWRTMERCGFTFIEETEWNSKKYELKLS
jgi:RimJ/RimL family protein N-acetyltransferase